MRLRLKVDTHRSMNTIIMCASWLLIPAILCSCGKSESERLRYIASELCNELEVPIEELRFEGRDFVRSSDPVVIFSVLPTAALRARFTLTASPLQWQLRSHLIQSDLAACGMSIMIPAGREIYYFRASRYSIFMIEDSGRCYLIFHGGL